MENASTSLIARDDTLFGVCQALAEDFGFNPLGLRIVLALPLLWNPALGAAAYAVLGVLVLFSRLVFPAPRIAAAEAPAALPAASTLVVEAPEVAAPVAEAPADVLAAEAEARRVQADRLTHQLLPLAA
jgi:phage shock protein PspC (stress-responsive transcriptional regulator)